MAIEPSPPSASDLSSGRRQEASSQCPATSEARGTQVAWFALTTLLGAFLVFQVQPVISKCVLPWFGGTPAVWTTCMLFFQVLLFAGYLYAHLLREWFSPRGQAVVHLVLLSVAAWTLPIAPSDAWKPTGGESPTWYLLWMLAAHVGLPYFVLSSTGPLVQAWLSYRVRSERVYRLYAVSNAGSLVALLSYPFAVEPFLSVSAQSVVWSLLFCLFVLVQGSVAIGLLRLSSQASSAGGRAEAEVQVALEAKPIAAIGLLEPEGDLVPGWRVMAAWVLLPALASTLLLTITNHVCQDIAVIPFLWILPLSLYLVSFIVCFDSPQHYRPKLFAAVTLLSLLAIQSRDLFPTSMQLIVEAASCMLMLFGVCLLCHGEVARLKPQVSRLTQFYAMVSAGGALGGVLVAIICPMVFNHFAEWPVAIAIVTALSFLLLFVCRGWGQSTYDWDVAVRLQVPVAALVVAPLIAMAVLPRDEVISSDRNFFGVLQVTRTEQGIQLVHGKTIHGIQRHGEASREPTSYYGRDSGIGRTLAALQQNHRSLHVGVVGLGCGVLATYGREADLFEMIEINPAVMEIAERHFSFLRDSQATFVHHLGDGRLVLERMPETRFDLLVLDAFSSDAIPAHLLTREAFELYRARIADDGVIAVHLSNNHLELVPLVQRLAADLGLEGRAVRSQGDATLATQAANWVIAADGGDAIWAHPLLSAAEAATPEMLRRAPRWTDQHHNLVSVLKLW